MCNVYQVTTSQQAIIGLVKGSAADLGTPL